MNVMITINNQQITAKEYRGQRVITFKDIDLVHGRPEGTAKRNFNQNKEHLLEGVDYFFVKPADVQPYDIRTSEINNAGTYLLTESGYLMLVKSLTDDLAWDVQRDLVKKYFRPVPELSYESLSPELQMFKQIFDSVVQTQLAQKQQQAALEAVNKRVDHLGDVITLSPVSWREDAHRLINGIAKKLGGNESLPEVHKEIYALVDERAGVLLAKRLTNKRHRMADEGVCKSKRDRVNKLDVIAEDKKLIEIYLAIVKEMAIKYGVTLEKDAEAS